MDLVTTYTGFIGIVKPGEDNVIFEDFSYTSDKEGMNEAFIKIIDLVTEHTKDQEPGKINNAGFLPSPFDDFTMFMNYDQFDPDIKYNLGFFGTPVFGNLAFLLVDKNSPDGKILPIPEDKKEALTKAVANFKNFEKQSGIYDAMTKVDKNEFLKQYLEEQNSILEESSKDIKGDKAEELEAAKKELEETLKK